MLIHRLHVVAFALTFYFQIPIQRVFDRQAPRPAQRLITTDVAFRKLPLGLNALLWLAMFWRDSGLSRSP